ncbi:hypothetical protein L204_104128 [Cryptococcus depauperatus]
MAEAGGPGTLLRHMIGASTNMTTSMPRPARTVLGGRFGGGRVSRGKSRHCDFGTQLARRTLRARIGIKIITALGEVDSLPAGRLIEFIDDNVLDGLYYVTAKKVWDCARVQHEVVVRRTSAVPSFTTQPTGLLLESLVNILTVVHIPTSGVRAKTSWVANETVKDAYTRLFELENAGLW